MLTEPLVGFEGYLLGVLEDSRQSTIQQLEIQIWRGIPVPSAVVKANVYAGTQLMDQASAHLPVG